LRRKEDPAPPAEVPAAVPAVVPEVLETVVKRHPAEVVQGVLDGMKPNKPVETPADLLTALAPPGTNGKPTNADKVEWTMYNGNEPVTFPDVGLSDLVNTLVGWTGIKNPFTKITPEMTDMTTDFTNGKSVIHSTITYEAPDFSGKVSPIAAHDSTFEIDGDKITKIMMGEISYFTPPPPPAADLGQTDLPKLSEPEPAMPAP
jgi:hypothetical protein